MTVVGGSRRGASSWPSPLAWVAALIFPVLAVVIAPTLESILADLPLGRGAAISALWVDVAVLTLAVALVMFATPPLVVALGRPHPRVLVRFLERGVRTALVGLAVLVAGEAVLATGIVLVVERLVLGHAYPGSMAVTLVGGFAGVFVFARVAARYPARAVEVTAVEVAGRQQPWLAGVIDDLAARLNVPHPDHVLVGSELTFFVTRTPVVADDEPLAGTCLYLSWPLLRLLSREQAEAVIAHEMGHLDARHLDLATRLARGYERLSSAQVHLDTDVADNPLYRLGTRPAAIWLRHLMTALRGPTAAARRPYELEADRAAADAFGPAPIGGALVILAVARALAPLWTHLATDPRAIALAGGETPLDRFAASVDEYLASPDLDVLLAVADTGSTHPAVIDRLRAIGLDAQAPSVALDPAIGLIADRHAIESTLARRMREGPRTVRRDVINRLRLEVGVGGTLAVLGAFCAFTLLALVSGNELGNQASAIRAGVLLMGVTAAAGIAYVGLQQEIVFDEHGISVTGWFRRIRRRRSSIVPWATVRRATVGHVRSIRLETDGRRLEIHGTWLSEQDIRRVIEALRSHGVPVGFKRGARGLDDERRAVVWYGPGRFLVPTLRRAVDGATVETEPLREVAVDPALLHGALAAALRQPPAPMGPRSRPVDVRAREPDARRVVVAGSARVTTIRIDGFAEHWWVPGPPDAWTAVALILDVFELIEPDDGIDAGLDRDGGGSLADGSSA